MPIDPAKPLKPLVAGWLEKIKLGLEWKEREFSRDAREIVRFFNGKSEDFWKTDVLKKFTQAGIDSEDIGMPNFRMVVNLAFEYRAIMGPGLYYQNPNRQVNPRKFTPMPPGIFGNPMDPNVQMFAMQNQMQLAEADNVRMARASLMETALNYTPNELGMASNMRSGVDDALLKGMGVWWTEIQEQPGRGKLVGSFYDSVDNLVLDPDATRLSEIQWCARRCVHPVWQVERDYGLPAGYLKGKGNLESLASQGETVDNETHKYFRMTGQSNDLLVYWKVYSKMGLGDRLTGMQDELKGVFDEFGDNCFLAVAEGLEHPLNLPTDLVKQAAGVTPTMIDNMGQPIDAYQIAFESVQWPIPFHIDGGWPFTPLAFHWHPNQLYPVSPLRPGLAEIKFLNWAMSFLATKVRTTCRDFVAILKAAENDLRTKFLEGRDLTILDIPNDLGEDIHKIVQFLQHPPLNMDLYKLIEWVFQQFYRRVGLSDAMYAAQATQERSATAASNTANFAQIRPADMAQCVDVSQTELARKEAFGLYWVCEGQDLAPILGPNAGMWDALIRSQDPYTIAREYDYRIEAGSSRRPNKDMKIGQMNQAMQVLGPILQAFAQMGMVQPMNALIADWCKANDHDSAPYMIPPPPPPPQMGPPQGPPGEQGANNNEGPPQQQ